ncbi:MAG: right-handed parallel beta-helix repeat-containing protein, partial [Phycisphaerales bacterium]|nr:right-handed parallel beta-helix repeat-containing protein [Phycisphaerales bacterium]
MRQRLCVAAVVLLAATAFTRADILMVPTGYPTIQSAIDAAADFDQILVDPGVYGENIRFFGKAIHLRSVAGPSQTVIDGGHADSVIRCIDLESSDTIIEGFTIQNGAAAEGGGLLCIGSSPVILNCSVVNCAASVRGGGVCLLSQASPAFSSVQIASNTASDFGGGMAVDSSSEAALAGVDFIGNSTLERGGGLSITDFSTVQGDGCTFDGNSAGYDGGGLFSDGSASTISNSTFTSNQALNGDGGAIAATGSYSTLTNVDIVGNHADEAGGGVSSISSIDMTISGGSISNNTASQHGGGLWSSSSTLNISGTMISGNVCPQGGGGAHVDTTILTISGATFADNDAGSGANGGGLWCEGVSMVNITSSTFDSNVAGFGGGMYAAQASMSLDGCAFNENDASLGGGMFNSDNAPDVLNTTFTGNRGFAGGGGVFNEFLFVGSFDNCDFIGNQTGDNAGGGGMVNTADAAPSILYCRFDGNSAVNGGGMLNNFNSSPFVLSCTFENNTVSGYGGGVINWNDSSPRFAGGCVFRNNSADYGGAVMNFTRANALFESAVFEDNTAVFSGGAMVIYDNSDTIVMDGHFEGNESGTGGGAVLIQAECDAQFLGGIFAANHAGTSGGAIYNYDRSRGVFAGITFTGNTASADGGAFYNTDQADGSLDSCTFDGNFAGSRGGALFCIGSAPRLGVCEFAANSAINWGGAIASDGASPQIHGCTIHTNTAGIGGGLALKGGSPRVISSVIRDNAAGGSGGGLFLFPDVTATLANLTVTENAANIGGGLSMDLGASSMTNSIVFGNTAPTDANVRGTALTISASLIGGGYAGPGGPILDADPGFVSPGSDDFHLLPSSPAVNGGDYTLLPMFETVDLDGNRRISGGQIDMGAYEIASRTHHVPVDFHNIQEAIYSADNGDTIVVAPGVYAEAIDLVRKSLSIIGATGRGGGVIIDASSIGGRTVNVPDPGAGGSVLLQGLTITGGSANNGGGLSATGHVTVRDCLIVDNTAPQRGGGMFAGRDVRVEDCTFLNNTAGSWGGGVSLGLSYGGARATFLRCQFNNCTAGAGAAVVAQAGGGIFVDCDLTGNNGLGAAWVFDYGFLEFLNCRVTENAGVGIRASSAGFLEVRNSLIARNAGTGILIGTFIQADIVNCTIVDNIAPSRGGGLFINQFQSDTRIDNCVIWGNEDHYLLLPEPCAEFPWDCGCDPEFETCDCDNRPDICVEGPPGTDQVYIQPDSFGTVVMNNSCIQDGWPWPDGTGNTSSDPLFVDGLGMDGMPGTGDEDFNLQGTSPCIDIGDASLLITRRDEYDLDLDGRVNEYLPIDVGGNLRLRNGRVDAGAFEAVAGPTHSTWTSPISLPWNDPGAWAPAGPPLPSANVIFDGIAYASSYIGEDVAITGMRVDNGYFSVQWTNMTLMGGIYGSPLQVGVWSDTPARFDFDFGHLYTPGTETLQIGEPGTLGGNGTIDLDIENGGSIDPAGPGSGGWLTVNHNYVGRFTDPFGRETIGDITIDVLTSTPPPPGTIDSSHDVLNLGPEADLDQGSLTVRLGPGVNPPVGAVFETIRVNGQRTGTFDVAFLPGLPGWKFFRVVYDYEPSPARGGRGTTPYNVFLIVDALGGELNFNSSNTFTISGLATDTAVGDLNGDNRPDCAITIPAANPDDPGTVLVLFNGGVTDGTWNGWTASTQVTVGRHPISLDIGELDGAPGLDIAVLNRDDDSLTILTNDGAGVLTAATPIGNVADDGRAVVIFDADNDGDQDIALTGVSYDDTLGSGSPAGLGLLTVLENTAARGGGTLSFGSPMFFAANDDPGDLDPADFDNDKDPDLAILSREPREVGIFTNDLSGGISFTETRSVDVGGFPVDVQASDLDGDNLPDLVTGNRDGESVSVILNRSSGGVLNTTGALEYDMGGKVRSIAAADLDDDGTGDLDLAVAVEDSNGDGVVYVLRNDSTL